MGKEPAHLMAIFKGKMVVYAVSRGAGEGSGEPLAPVVTSPSCPVPPGWHLTVGQHGAHTLHPPLPRAWHQ